MRGRTTMGARGPKNAPGYDQPLSPRLGLSLIEILISLAVFSLLFTGVYLTLSHSSSSAHRVSQRLFLQMEVRRALLSMYSLFQEGIELVLPPPGSTQSHVAIRDIHNAIHLLFLRRNADHSRADGEDRFDVVHLTTKPGATPHTSERVILGHVKKMTFSVHDYGGVLIKAHLSQAGGNFALVHFIHLKNRDATDF